MIRHQMLLTFAFVLSTATAAQAVPVVTYDGGTGYATGIKNLNVNSDLFDVDFVGDSYNNVYAVEAPYFLGNEAGAEAAADAIMNVLNDEPTVPEIADGTSEVLWVPYNAVDGSFNTEQRGHDTDADPWQSYADFSGSTGTDYSGPPNSWLFAKFSLVPEPATFSLALVATLFLLGRLRRR